MNPNNSMLLFLQEIFSRLKTKSPTFFIWWQRILSVITAVTGLPEFLSMFSIKLPPAATILENKIVAIFTMGMLFMSMMPTQQTAVAMSTNGTMLKETDDKTLPFTAAKEVKAEAKKEAAANLVGTSVALPVVDIKK